MRSDSTTLPQKYPRLPKEKGFSFRCYRTIKKDKGRIQKHISTSKG